MSRLARNISVRLPVTSRSSTPLFSSTASSTSPQPFTVTQTRTFHQASATAVDTRRFTPLPLRQPVITARPTCPRTTSIASIPRANSNLANSSKTTSSKTTSPSAAAASDLSTDAQAAATAAAAAQQAPNAGASQGPPLDWDTFFALRTRRRRIQVALSILSGVAGMSLGAGLLSTGLAEPLVSSIPLDPFVTLGLLVFACGGMGWLLGPTVGNQIFYLRNFRLKGQILQKEAEFFARVKRNRVDPSNSSAGNPVPDFYGEKISSVAGYRQWLKDQRAFNKKKTRNFV